MGKQYINVYLDKVFIINLRRRPDRLENIILQCDKLGIKYQIFDAVDGYTEENLKKYQEYVAKPLTDPMEIKKNKKLICSPGALGYLYTWKALLLYAIKHGIESFLSLDDDIIFHKKFHEKFQNAIMKIPKNWKIINFGATQMEKYMPTIDDNATYYQPMICDGSFATAIHYSIYDDLLALIDNSILPFDSGPLRTIYKRYPDDCYVIYPNIIIANLLESDIRSGKKIETITKIIAGWNLNDFNIQPITKKCILIYLENDNISCVVKRWVEIWIAMNNLHINCKLWKLNIVVYDDGLPIHYKTQIKKLYENVKSDKTYSILPKEMITSSERHGIKYVKDHLKSLYNINEIIDAMKYL
jgi:GR25 family glycosyltransferase involved in LPS biosynthesis